MKVISVAEMRDLERQTLASGTSEQELQDRAGSAVAEAVAARWPTPAVVLALVGTGRNGRDAWIAARRLRQFGWQAGLYLCPGHSITAAEKDEFTRAGGKAVDHSEGTSELDHALSDATVILDGLLGLGARGEPRQPLRGIIQALNEQRRTERGTRVVAVDTPSGLDPDTGRARGIAVIADLTVVLGGAKQGLLSAAASSWTGELAFADIGLAPGPSEAAEVVTLTSLAGMLSRTPLGAHKGTLGRLLVLAGSARYAGAAYLVTAAAVRAGAGLVVLAAPPWLRDVVASRLAEITFLPLPDGGPAAQGRECVERLTPQLNRFDAVAVGPGLSTDGSAGDVVEAVLRHAAVAGLPVVVDADGLNALATRPGWENWIGQKVVLTPHLGELARLVGTNLAPDEPAWELAGRLSRAWGVTVVVKGPFTGIGSGRNAWVHARPNPVLATAGTGDVLTGIVGALLARGLTPSAAARLGVWAHGAAAANISADFGAGGLAASDLLPQIPRVLAQAVS